MQVVNSLISKIQKATKLQRPSFSSSQLLLWVAFGAILSAALIVRIIPAKYGFYLNDAVGSNEYVNEYLIELENFYKLCFD